ncbi:MAG: acyl-ACP--UDP-N-acetylglucosamine O-acyltransferase [Acidobacteria bacterium]|nr:acyl-ACP--UDP-N-acetylglucosamine O-acyltransferase [Acidobacteriota bacterium]
MAIHATAIVDPAAHVDASASIGPFCVVGARVSIGARTVLKGHNFVEGPTTIGEDNLFYPFSSIGVASQDLKYQGEDAETIIGSHNLIREFVTVHRGTRGGGAVTRVGDHNLLMAYAHVAHDCQVGNHVVLGHGATLGGHVAIGDHARVSAFVGVHQFCRVGASSIIGGYVVITRDVMPFAMVSEEREAKMYRANSVGLERRGFAPEAIEAINKAFRILRTEGQLAAAIERIRAEVPQSSEIDQLIEFIERSERGFIK